MEDIVHAVRQGERPDGGQLAPLMPWPEYAHLTDEDTRALATYLKSLTPIEHATPARADDPGEAKKPFLMLQFQSSGPLADPAGADLASAEDSAISR